MRIKIRIWSMAVSTVVLYGCETWSHALWEERGLRVFENRVLRKQFGPNLEQVTGDERKLHYEELHVICCPLQIKEDQMGRAYGTYGEKIS